MERHFSQVLVLAIHLQGAIEQCWKKCCRLRWGIVLDLASSTKRADSLLVE